MGEELKAMGMDRQDISDLKQLAELMHEFLINVPNLKLKLEIVSNNDLLDNIQLYLLGLPNKLGPLGYIALHHILDGEETGETGEIVDVVVEGPKKKEPQPRAEPESEPEPESESEPERAQILA